MRLPRLPRRPAVVAASVASLLIAGVLVARADSGPVSAAAPAAAATASWNRHVACRATVTTLAKVLGTARSAQGGATFAGGGFRPGIPDRRDIRPPCRVGGKPTLVELHRVKMGSCSKINLDGDWTCTVTDPRAKASRSADLNHIHIESDGNFRKARFNQPNPPGGTLLDVQGFVFWDPGHTTAGWHNHSGWELHTFTAWRRAK